MGAERPLHPRTDSGHSHAAPTHFMNVEAQSQTAAYRHHTYRMQTLYTSCSAWCVMCKPLDISSVSQC